MSTIDDRIEIADHHVCISCFCVKQQLFQRQASSRKRSGPIPHGQSHACPGVEMREIIAGLMLLLCRITRWLGPPIASNPFTVRQADRRTSLLLASLLGCVRLSAVWPDRAIDMILNHVQEVRLQKQVEHLRPRLREGTETIKSNTIATCTSFAELSEAHAKTRQCRNPAASLQSPDVRFKVVHCTSCGGDTNVHSAIVYSSSNGSSKVTE